MDIPTPPVIEGLNGKVGVLERRLAHLEERLTHPERKGASQDFDRAEAAALRAALKAMKFVDEVRRRLA